MPRYTRQRGTAVHLRIGQPERGAVQGKRLHSSRTGAQLLGRGTNQGNWGDNYEPDAAIIKGLAGQVVRTLIRWQGTAYPEGTDSYNSLAANSYLDPANYAQFKLELDWLEAQGLWIIVAFDTDNGAGNRGLGTADWNFYDTTDTANQAKYREEFKQAWLRIAADCAQRERILCYELMPEPMPTGSNAGHAAPLQAYYVELMQAIRTVDASTPFLIGPRASYGANFLAESLIAGRSDYMTTIDMLTGKVEDEVNVAAVVEGLSAFRDANNVLVLVQQVGRETADDEGQGSTSENSGLTALNGVLSCLNAHGIPYTHWQFHQNSTNPLAYGLYYKTNANVNSADNWTPKPAEIAAFQYHMRQTGAALEAAAIAAATACGGELFYVKSDLSNVYQTADQSTPVTAIGQTVGRINAVVGTVFANQATAGSRPVLAAGVNGYAMQFDGTDDWLGLSVTYFASGDDCTVVAACRAPAGSANRVIFHVGNTSTTVRNPFVAVLATDEMQVSWRGDDNVLTGAASTTGCDNRAIVASGSKVGSTKKAFLQGVQEGTTDSTAVGSAASITRARLGGTSTATNLFTGPIALLFVCKTTVTAEQRRAIERWGAWLVGAPFRGAIPA